MKDSLASYGRSHLEASFSFEGVPSLVVNGDIAQLGERLNGIQEVSGSIPLVSTIFFMFLENCTQKKKEKPLLKAKAGEET